MVVLDRKVSSRRNMRPGKPSCRRHDAAWVGVGEFVYTCVCVCVCVCVCNVFVVPGIRIDINNMFFALRLGKRYKRHICLSPAQETL